MSRADKSIVVLAAFGTVIMAYLTTVHYSAGGSSFCNFGPGLSCNLVNKSVFSEIAGVPVSVLGLVFFAGAIALTLRRDPARHRLLALAAIFSLVFSTYLSGLEYFWLGSVCLFCELSKVLIIAMLVISVSEERRGGRRFGARPLIAAALLGVAFTAAAFLLQRG